MYDIGFRKAVLQYRKNSHTYIETCCEFGITQQTLRNWIKRDNETGSPYSKYRGTEPRALDRDELKTYVDGHPDAYQHEIAAAMGCSRQCVGYNLRKMGYTLK